MRKVLSTGLAHILVHPLRKVYNFLLRVTSHASQQLHTKAVDTIDNTLSAIHSELTQLLILRPVAKRPDGFLHFDVDETGFLETLLHRLDDTDRTADLLGTPRHLFAEKGKRRGVFGGLIGPRVQVDTLVRVNLAVVVLYLNPSAWFQVPECENQQLLA